MSDDFWVMAAGPRACEDFVAQRAAERAARETRCSHAYIGRQPCGCVTAIVVDDPDDKEFTATRVAMMVATGLATERLPLLAARRMFTTRCCHEAQQELFTEGVA